MIIDEQVNNVNDVSRPQFFFSWTFQTVGTCGVFKGPTHDGVSLHHTLTTQGFRVPSVNCWTSLDIQIESPSIILTACSIPQG